MHFFGHKDCLETIKPRLQSTLEDLVDRCGVDMFYVGKQGRFDAYVRCALKALERKCPHVRYAVVLAYVPGEARAQEDYSDTVLPEGIEAVHPRFAVSWANNWMLQRADVVVAYITHGGWGGAAQFVAKAERQGKRVINMA